MVTRSSILTWRIPWTEETGGLQSIGVHRVEHDWRDLARMRAWENASLGLLKFDKHRNCLDPVPCFSQSRTAGCNTRVAAVAQGLTAAAPSVYWNGRLTFLVHGSHPGVLVSTSKRQVCVEKPAPTSSELRLARRKCYINVFLKDKTNCVIFIWCLHFSFQSKEN